MLSGRKRSNPERRSDSDQTSVCALSFCIRWPMPMGPPGHKADSQFFAGIEQSIPFRVTVHERILCLERCDGLNGMCFADGVGAGFRETEMQHLAVFDKLFHGTRNVLDWHIWIDPMLIEE